MAKMFKHLVFGMKKNPPAPPRPDYEGERLAAGELDPPFFAHDYENIPKSKLRREGPRLQFAEAQHELLVFDNYSEPADLCTDRKEDVEDDPLYMSPLDDRGTAPPLDDEQEDDMYCVPYDTDVSAPPVHQPCFIRPQGYASHRLGRKAVLMYISVSFTFGWLMIAYAPLLSLLLAGRLVSGFCAGICSVAVPAYVVEISTPETRGLLSAGFQLAFAVGVFLEMTLGIFLRWSWLAVCGALVVVLSAHMLLVMPESPPWLMRMSRTNEALEGLKFLKGRSDNVAEELGEILEDESENGLTFQELFRPEMYKPLAISVSLMLFQQFAGINALVAYSVNIFQASESLVDPTVAATLVALVQILATLLSGLLLDKVGRKLLYIVSGGCMFASLVAGGFLVDAAAWPLISLVVYMVGFSLGFGPIPFVVAPELVPICSRSFLLSAASVANSCFSFVVIQTFDDLRGLFGLSAIYWIYAFFSLLGVFFYWKCVPETKGRSIDEIHRSFALRQNS